MIQMLEDTNDDNFESFSPREVSSYTKSKMVELSEEQKQIQQLLQDYRSEVLELNLKIDEVTSVIKVAQNENVQSSHLRVLTGCSAAGRSLWVRYISAS